jgi:probable F420-dependent oxidoreductase
MLELAAQRTAGAHPFLVTPEHTEAPARRSGPMRCCAPPAQTVIVESSPSRARELARQHLAIYLNMPNYVNNFKQMGYDESDFDEGGSDRLIDGLIAWGDAEDVKARVREHLDAGADHVAVHVVTPNDQPGMDAHRQGGLPVTQWRILGLALAELGRGA